jgi:pyruvate formate lyase activating enzyme
MASSITAPRSGIVFDIREFTVHDGPGIRTTVFMKGCRLRCNWCHNPEGLSFEPQWLESPAGRRLAGATYRSHELAELLNRQAPVLRSHGGVTFSGGEPLAQAAFVSEVIDQLDHLHVTLETSGWADDSDFCLVAKKSDLVLFDLKLIDPDEHRKWTGQDNAPILRHLQMLGEMQTPCIVRVPLIPGVTDTEANLRAIAATARGLPGLQQVELLPYHQTAGAKYTASGLLWQPAFDETQPVNADTSIFEASDIPVRLY